MRTNNVCVTLRLHFLSHLPDLALLQWPQPRGKNRPVSRRELGSREILRAEPEVSSNRPDGAHLSVLQ